MVVLQEEGILMNQRCPYCRFLSVIQDGKVLRCACCGWSAHKACPRCRLLSVEQQEGGWRCTACGWDSTQKPQPDDHCSECAHPYRIHQVSQIAGYGLVTPSCLFDHRGEHGARHDCRCEEFRRGTVLIQLCAGTSIWSLRH